MNQKETYYDILQIAKNASPEVIRFVYQKLAQKYHPDRNGGSPESQGKMKQINEAYKVLSDPIKRREYDQLIKEQERVNGNNLNNTYSYTSNNDGIVKYNQSARENFSLPEGGGFYFFEINKEMQDKLKKINSVTPDDCINIEDNYDWGKKKYDYLGCHNIDIIYLIFPIVPVILLFITIQSVILKISNPFIYQILSVSVLGILMLLTSILNNLILYKTSPLAPKLIISPIYIIKFTFNKVIYIPIWEVTSICVKDGNPDRVIIKTINKKIKFYTDNNFSLHRFFIAHELSRFVAMRRENLRSNIEHMNFEYIINNDIFYSIQKEEISWIKKILYLAKPVLICFAIYSLLSIFIMIIF